MVLLLSQLLSLFLFEGICSRTFTLTGARAGATFGARVDKELFAAPKTFLEFIKNALNMLDIRILFN